MAQQNKNPISWQAMEFKHYHKSIGWFLALYCIALLLIVYEIFEKDLFAAVTIFILAVFTTLFARQKPKIVDVNLNSQGIKIDNISIPYKQIKHFWIVEHPDHRTLNFETTAYFHNSAVLELGDADPEDIRHFLLGHLYEHEDSTPTFVQRVMHRLKF